MCPASGTLIALCALHILVIQPRQARWQTPAQQYRTILRLARVNALQVLVNETLLGAYDQCLRRQR